MSGVQKAIGKAVEFVIRQNSEIFSPNAGAWMTVGEVAEACEISKPTARKYIRILVEAGLVEESETHSPMDTRFFIWKGGK